MKTLKIIGIVLLVITIVLETLFTLFFLFSKQGYGIDFLSELFEPGFFAGIKGFFIEIWDGIKVVFKA